MSVGSRLTRRRPKPGGSVRILSPRCVGDKVIFDLVGGSEVSQYHITACECGEHLVVWLDGHNQLDRTINVEPCRSLDRAFLRLMAEVSRETSRSPYIRNYS
jgi:hypothetical protein